MDVRVKGAGRAAPFLSARDLFETEYDLDVPVHVRVRDDPDERTRTEHYDDRHVLTISTQAATSAMARELALHEYAHMHRHEGGHPSHTQSTEEALFLALAGRSIERYRLTHCYQIANHMRDIYADDITLRVGPPDKLVAFLESGLATAVADRPHPSRAGWVRETAGTASDPDLTAVNAAFALALVERHDLVGSAHRIYDLAHAAGNDAPRVELSEFKGLFTSLAPEPTESDFRRRLVEATRTYASATGVDGPAAD
ncbi:hypothetical protein BRD17_04350 [Halobacteriales archaeon SW_7_68_16]|nr:MAG: hypothetical protein BRD17_04350 [Halobacteriales archaeon SW_7_68_16]